MIKDFTILGERCSGTNFLEKAITANFKLPVTWRYGWKHFFGFDTYSDSQQTLFIAIIRDPVDWMNSLYNQPWHLQRGLRGNVNNFLNGEFWSFNDEHSGLKDNSEIMEDRNIYTLERYKNIFECRSIKLQFLLNDMPGKVKNYIFIRYEDLRDHYDQTLTMISKEFNLRPVYPKFRRIEGYKGSGRRFIAKTVKPIDRARIIKHRNFNLPIEDQTGYL